MRYCPGRTSGSGPASPAWRGRGSWRRPLRSAAASGALPRRSRPGRRGRAAGDAIAGDPAVLDQPLEADQQRVARKGRERRVRRAAVSGGAQRKNLPEALLRGGQEIDKGIGGGAEVADAAVGGQRSNVQQNSRQTILNSAASALMLPLLTSVCACHPSG